jgi:glutathionylspermidine synthase
MQRETLISRPGWQREMESLGFSYHSIDGVYWDETRCYRFTAAQIDELEAATAELHQMALNAAQYVIGAERMDEFAIPRDWQDCVRRSWKAHLDDAPEAFSLFGRMDLCYDGTHPPKLLEYNADTPTACLEASVAQWHWLQAVRPHADQFNSIHEKLIDAWRGLRARTPHGRIHFAAVAEAAEDWGNVNYLRDTAVQAGWQTFALPIEQIGHNGTAFVDEAGAPIDLLFKLYPWEWLVCEEFGPRLRTASMRVIEPAWKMLLSNKALLTVLWELYPDHPNLLPTFREMDGLAAAALGEHYVKKPKLAREGANITWVDGGLRQSTEGSYGDEGFVYQALAPLPRFGIDYALIGSWIVNGQPAGIGIREDATPITCNTSRFIPHYFVD